MSKDSVDILQKGRKVFDDAIRKEARAQGHYLTGNFENSLTATITKAGNETIIEGEAAYYQKYLEEGFPAKSASMKQFPFVKRYWELRGLNESDSNRAAFLTIKKWMREGMPTQSSERFSKTGKRKNFLTIAFSKTSKRVDDIITGSFDKGIDTRYHKTKSETI